eukprot:1141294-Pelagomonas_calceolata.AAC.4
MGSRSNCQLIQQPAYPTASRFYGQPIMVYNQLFLLPADPAAIMHGSLFWRTKPLIFFHCRQQNK